MRYISSIYLGVALSALAAAEANAQWNLARFAAERNRVYTTFGLDPALVSTVGYGRVVPVFGRDFVLTADVGVVTAHMDTRDFRARVGTQASVVRWRSVHLAGSATFITRGTENTVYSALGFGADLAGALGVYRPRWFAAGEFGFDKAIITHVTNSDWYRQNVYPDAKDGWYLDAGGTYHYGVSAGYSMGSTELTARAGWRRTERWADLSPGMYATLGIGFGF